MRPPSTTLVLDAAILVAVRARSSGALLAATGKAVLVTTDRVVQEARRRITLGLKRPDLVDLLDDLVELLTIRHGGETMKAALQNYQRLRRQCTQPLNNVCRLFCDSSAYYRRSATRPIANEMDRAPL